MKRIFEKLFKKSPQQEIIEFSKLIISGESLSVCFTPSSYINYQLLSRFASWKDQFSEIKFYLPSSQLSFWGNIQLAENFSINSLEKIEEADKEFIINFSDEDSVLDILDTKVNCAIADIDNRYNLLFEPLLNSEVELVYKLEQFFEDSDFYNENLQLSLMIESNKDRFVLDIGNSVSGKKCLILIDNLKKDYSDEIFLVGAEIDTAEFVSLQKYPLQDLFEKYKMAVSGKVFFTDDADTARLFSIFGLDLIYIGKKKLDNIRCIDVMDNFEIKNSIPEIISRG
ncbi:MAG: hypothetical protein KAS49_05885 [Candidatus Cloacimonetes bacterium]|nr:hypothetical protein [Candidatus Cloacimonadota bacterium]